MAIIQAVAFMIGMGSGKANAVPDAMRKASDTARKNMKKVNLYKTTIPHEVYGRCGGAVVMMVAIDGNMKVRGIEILSHGETAGLGAKITEDKFKSQFPGKDAEGLSVVKNPTTNPNEFEAVTGATISSRAVEDGVKQACDMVTELLLTKEGAE